MSHVSPDEIPLTHPSTTTRTSKEWWQCRHHSRLDRQFAFYYWPKIVLFAYFPRAASLGGQNGGGSRQHHSRGRRLWRSEVASKSTFACGTVHTGFGCPALVIRKNPFPSIDRMLRGE